MKQAHADIINRTIVPIFFTQLTSSPGTGKSAALEFVQKAHEAVEKFLQVPDEMSRQVMAPTIEGFIDVLSRLIEVIGK